MALGTSNNVLTHYTWKQPFQRSFTTTQSNEFESVQVFTHNYLCGIRYTEFTRVLFATFFFKKTGFITKRFMTTHQAFITSTSERENKCN
jgi:hypothetical protein